MLWNQIIFSVEDMVYTKVDTKTRVDETEKTETIRQDNCQCACNSATEVPEEPDTVIIAKDFSGNQLQIDYAGGNGG